MKYTEKKISDYPSYEINPVHPEGIYLRTEKVGGRKDELTLHSTGETLSASVGSKIDFRLHDPIPFRKLYEDTLHLRRKLTIPAQLVLDYILINLPQDVDYIILNMTECRSFCEYTADVNVYRGIKDLLENGWLYRGTGDKKYWINVNRFFNGDRRALENIHNYTVPKPKKITKKKKNAR